MNREGLYFVRGHLFKTEPDLNTKFNKSLILRSTSYSSLTPGGDLKGRFLTFRGERTNIYG